MLRLFINFRLEDRVLFYAYVIYYLFVNVLAFVLYGVDKKRAIRKAWRIPESVLLGVAFLGGCVGAFIAMRKYHHKTRHASFAMGVPAMILLHGCLGVFLFMKEYIRLPLS